MIPYEVEHMLFLLKALADKSRLLMLNHLAKGEITVGALADAISLSEPTVSHHLARLREAGLVSLRMAGTQRFYSINSTGLAKFKNLASIIDSLGAPYTPAPTTPQPIVMPGWDPWEEQVLQKFLLNGQLTRMPAKHKKMTVILRWLATLFQAGRIYSEAEVNEILKMVYASDFVSLRRALIDEDYLQRERSGGNYWLAPENQKIPGQ